MNHDVGSRRPGWIFAAVSLALFCVQIDYFAMNLALPRMAADLGSSATDLQWVISIYMLALGAFMVPAGRIGDIFGRRRALLTGIALFGVASVLCAVSSSAAMVVGFRALQGLGAALIFPVSVSVLTNAFPPKRARHAIGMAYGIAGLGNAAGPLFGALSIEESSDKTVPRRIDIAGLSSITVGVGLFTLAFDRGSTWGWLSGWTVCMFVLSIMILAAFVFIENKVRWPLVDLSLEKNPRFSVLVVAGTVSNIAYAAAMGGALSGRLAARRPQLVMGSVCIAAAVSLAALSGLIYAFTTVATQSAVRPERAGQAAGVALTSMVTMAGVGVAVSGTVLEILQRAGVSTGGAIDLVFVVLAAALLPAGLVVIGLDGFGSVAHDERMVITGRSAGTAGPRQT